ncbi:MAG TPA: tetratricopeptide repeat protein [Methylocystis sp.]|nr:tetratricopeptide repeat protein [Methylocystis sp.]
MSKTSLIGASAPRGAKPHLLRVLATAALVAAGASVGSARESLVVPRPFEVGTSLSGNFLSAIVAHSERDTLAASTFFQEAMRGDPRNHELVERALVDALANGESANASALSAKVLSFDRSNAVALLAQAVDALSTHQYSHSRDLLARDAARRDGDIKDVLLTAWAYAGEKKTKRALATLDRLRGEGYSVLRDYHAALIADLGGDKVEAERRFKATVASDRTVLRLIDAYGRFLSGRGDNEGAKRLYRAFNEAAPNNPLVLSALAQLEEGKTLAPLIADAQAGAGEALYVLVSLGNRQGDELAALIYLRLALQLAPNNMPATFTLAEIYERLQQEEAAIAVYDSVPEGSPLRLAADVRAAAMLEKLGKSREAGAHLQSLVEANPQNAEALTALADLQRSRKSYAEAAQTYTQALDLRSKPDKSQWALYYCRGISYERSKNWPKAEADLKHALELNPDQPEILNYLGYSWVDQGVNLDEAFRMLRRAVDLDGRNGYVVDSLGWSYYRLGRYEEAVKELERAIDLKPADPVINDHLGDAYWRVGRKLEAQFQWNHARDLNPEPEDLPKILDKIKNGLGDNPTIANKDANRGG